LILFVEGVSGGFERENRDSCSRKDACGSPARNSQGSLRVCERIQDKLQAAGGTSLARGSACSANLFPVFREPHFFNGILLYFVPSGALLLAVLRQLEYSSILSQESPTISFIQVLFPSSALRATQPSFKHSGGLVEDGATSSDNGISSWFHSAQVLTFRNHFCSKGA
jgi:hypothetical protein